MIALPSIPVVMLASALLGIEPDAPRRVMIGRDLSRTEIVVDALDSSGVHTRDAKGSRRIIPHTDLLALYRPARVTTVPGTPVLSLTDGQRIVGSLAKSADGLTVSTGDDVMVEHPSLGVVRVPLDAVSTLVMPGMPAPGRASGDDLVLLSNGDAVRGLVTRVGAQIAIEGESGGERLIPLDAVASVRLQNPIQRASGPTVWLADGCVVRVSMPGTASEAGLVALDPALTRVHSASESEPSPGVPTTILDNVIGWMPDAGRLVPLSRLEFVGVSPLAPRPWTDAPVIGAGDEAPLSAAEIRMPGPCVATWKLPPNADGVSCEVVLPEAFRDWGDCEVVIGASSRADGTAPTDVWRGRVNAERPVATVSADLPAGSATLVVRVEPGERGPVQDRPTLAFAMIRVSAR